jgi:hypothetical protein
MVWSEILFPKSTTRSVAQLFQVCIFDKKSCALHPARHTGVVACDVDFGKSEKKDLKKTSTLGCSLTLIHLHTPCGTVVDRYLCCAMEQWIIQNVVF